MIYHAINNILDEGFLAAGTRTPKVVIANDLPGCTSCVPAPVRPLRAAGSLQNPPSLPSWSLHACTGCPQCGYWELQGPLPFFFSPCMRAQGIPNAATVLRRCAAWQVRLSLKVTSCVRLPQLTPGKQLAWQARLAWQESVG